GFYENAFGLMRACYAELGRDRATCRIADWRDAFEPAPIVAVTERMSTSKDVSQGAGSWDPWVAHFPPGRGLPGDPLVERNPFSVRAYLSQSAMLIVEMLRSAQARQAERAPERPPAAGAGGGAPEQVVEAV